MCVDFRKINDLQPQVRRVDSATSGNISLVPLPKINEMYAALCGANIFTMLDLRSGYYHINLDEKSKAKTAFVTPFGKYEFNSVPFGLAQAPAYFQQLISMVLQDCRDFMMAYLDDIIIFSRTPEEHLKHIEIIFQKSKWSPSVTSSRVRSTTWVILFQIKEYNLYQRSWTPSETCLILGHPKK